MPVLSSSDDTRDSKTPPVITTTSSSSSSTSTTYQLAGTSTSFNTRTRDVFAALQSVEAAHQRHEELHEQEADRLVKADPCSSDFPMYSNGKAKREEYDESKKLDYYFHPPKPPSGGRGRSRRLPASVPDHVLNPNKYTKYSLDVPTSDTSEAVVTAAALSFIAERKQMREDAEREEEPSLPERVVFKAPSRPSSSNTACKAKLVDGKMIMPEYVVGENIKKLQKQTTETLPSPSVSENTINLTHLENSDDEVGTSSSQPTTVPPVLSSSSQSEIVACNDEPGKDVEIKFMGKKFNKIRKNIRQRATDISESEEET